MTVMKVTIAVDGLVIRETPTYIYLGRKIPEFLWNAVKIKNYYRKEKQYHMT